MTYQKFIEGFMKATDQKKGSYIEKHLTTKYLPYASKITEAKEIVERSNYVTIGDKKIYKKNSPVAYFLFIQRIIANYTDITCESNKEEAAMFDALNECGLIDYIVAALPQREYQEFQTVLNMTQDDEDENYRSIAGFLDTKIDSINILLDALVEAASKNENDAH